MIPRTSRAAVVSVTLLAGAACSSGSAPATRAHAAATPTAHTSTTSRAAAHSPTGHAVAGLTARVVGSLPQGLSRTVAVDAGGHILVLSGLSPGDVSTSRVLSLDPSTGRSRLVGHLTEAVHDASGAFLGGRAVVFGGGAARSVADVQAFGSGGARVTGRLPTGRSDSAAATVGGTAYLVGGFDGQAMTRDVLATTDGGSFRRVARLVLGVRYPAVAAAGGFVWVFGGQLATTESTRTGGQTDDIQRIDPRTGKVTVAGHLPAPLGHATAFTLRGVLYVAGGRTGTTASSRVWRVDPRTAKVSAAGRLPMAYSDMASVVVGTNVWLIGGETTGPGAPLRTVVRLS